MSLQQGAYLIRAITTGPPGGFATAGGANETVIIVPQRPVGQTWQVVNVGPGKVIIESYDSNSRDKLLLSYSSDDFDGSPITTENKPPPSFWILRRAQGPNEFTLSPDVRSDGAEICATVRGDQMVIQPFSLDDDYRPTWEFIPAPLD